MSIRHEDLAAAGYREPSLDAETTRAYEASLRRKRDAVAGAITYLRREWPSVVKRIEVEARDKEMERMRAMRHDFQTLPHAEFPVRWPDWRDYEEVLPTYCSCRECRLWRTGS